MLLTPIWLIVRGYGSLDNAEAFEHALIIGGLNESYVFKHIVRNQQPTASHLAREISLSYRDINSTNNRVTNSYKLSWKNSEFPFLWHNWTHRQVKN